VNRCRFLQLLGGGALALGWGGPSVRLRGAGAAQEPVAAVRAAIGRRRCLEFTYAGHHRQVEPHALGVTAAGHRALLAWQFGGASRSQPPTGWRTFRLGGIRELRPTDRGFVPRADYARDGASLREVEVDVHSAGHDTEGRGTATS